MKVLIIGHVTIDLRGDRETIGGPPLYMAPVFGAFGNSIHIITSADSNFPFPHTPDTRFDVIESDHSTKFEFNFDQKFDERNLILKTRASDISISRVKQFIEPNYDIIVISPVANEIDKPLISYLQNFSSFIILDYQGLVRKIDKDGKVNHELDEDNFKWCLQNSHVLKISEEELGDNIIENPFNSILLITKGKNNIEIKSNNKTEEFNIIPKEDIIDDTGSGDIFLAGFSFYYFISQNLDESVKIGNYIAKMNLENFGIPSFDFMSEIISDLSLGSNS